MSVLTALPAGFWRRAAFRGFGFWFGIRAMLLLALAMAAGGSLPDFGLRFPAAVLLIAAASGIAALHAHAMRESVFLGNLGIARAALLAPAAFSAAAELIAQLAVAAMLP